MFISQMATNKNNSWSWWERGVLKKSYTPLCLFDKSVCVCVFHVGLSPFFHNCLIICADLEYWMGSGFIIRFNTRMYPCNILIFKR